MDIILICKDALENSLLSNIALAIEAKKNGSDPGIIFTQEALAALCGQAFRWSPLLANRSTKITILKSATAMGIEIAGEKDKRWTDIYRLIRSAKEAGVSLMACSLWVNLLKVGDSLPQEISVIESDTLLNELNQAKTIIGGL